MQQPPWETLCNKNIYSVTNQSLNVYRLNIKVNLFWTYKTFYVVSNYLKTITVVFELLLCKQK